MRLFGVEIDEREKWEIFNDIRVRIERGQKTFVVTANALIMLRVREDPVYREAVKRADLVIPDGTGVVLAAKMRGKEVQKYPGIDLAIDLMDEGKEAGWSFYLLGARDFVVEKLAEILSAKGLNVVGYHHGYFDGEGPADEIASLKPDVVLVAMGVPKQELWIASNIDKFEKGIFIGVGGTFDVLSGYKKRAPSWMRRMGLEWFYRFLQSPKERWNVPFKLAKFLAVALTDGRPECDSRIGSGCR